MADESLVASLRELLHYDPLTGIFTRKTKPRRRKYRVGDRADYVQKRGRAVGYCYIKCEKRRYSAHRLAWLWTYGEWPKHQIDHINGDPGDNRITNLRDVPQSLNQQNRRKPSGKSGLMGVSAKQGRWMAVLTLHGRQLFLGCHDTPEAAYEAYLAAKRKYHEGCTI